MKRAATTRRSGNPDAQAKVTLESAGRVVRAVLRRYRVVGPGAGLADLPYALFDTPSRPYHSEHFSSVVYERPPAPQSADRLVADLAALSAKDAGVGTPASWRRDIKAWIRKQQSPSPDKLARIARIQGLSWLDTLRRCGYWQHLVAFLDLLLEAKRPTDASTVAVSPAFLPNLGSGTDLEILERLDVFKRRLIAIEESPPLWEAGIPGRVFAVEIKDERLRAAFRLLDPADFEIRGVSKYPSPAALEGVAFYVGRALKRHAGYDPIAQPEQLFSRFTRPLTSNGGTQP